MMRRNGSGVAVGFLMSRLHTLICDLVEKGEGGGEEGGVIPQRPTQRYPGTAQVTHVAMKTKRGVKMPRPMPKKPAWSDIAGMETMSANSVGMIAACMVHGRCMHGHQSEERLDAVRRAARGVSQGMRTSGIVHACMACTCQGGKSRPKGRVKHMCYRKFAACLGEGGGAYQR